MSEQTQKEYIIRKEGTGTFGLGEVICDRVVLFRAGNWGLTQEELQEVLLSKAKVDQ